MKFLLHPIFFFVLLNTCFSQQLEEWVHVYNGVTNDQDLGYAIAIDKQNNIVVTGSTKGLGLDYDIITIKYNPDGDTLWTRVYNGLADDHDVGKDITTDDSLNVIICGRSTNVAGNRDFITVKYDSSGVQRWVRTYNSIFNGSDQASSLSVDDSGNVYVAGFAADSVLLIKYSPAGAQMWSKYYAGPLYSLSVGLKLITDSNWFVYLTASTADTTPIRNDILTVKLKTTGALEWMQTYNADTGSIDTPRDIKIDLEGNVIIAGTERTWSGNQFYDYVTIKYDSLGNQKWVAKYGTSNNLHDGAWALDIDMSGNVYVTGISNDDYLTLKYDSTGNEQWTRRFSGAGNSNDWAYAIVLDTMANVYITGGSTDSNMDFEYRTIKYNSSGNEIWSASYQGTSTSSWNIARDIAIDKIGNVYVTGGLANTGTDGDVGTIKYGVATGVERGQTIIDLGFDLFPNPTSGVFTVTGQGPVQVFDLLGREIATPGQAGARNDGMVVDLSGYPSGIYFVRLVLSGAEGVVGERTVKLILTK